MVRPLDHFTEAVAMPQMRGGRQQKTPAPKVTGDIRGS
jgi:hypothetical protein